MRRAWAIVGVVGGFLQIWFLTIPGWFALRSFRRWRRGEQAKPLFAWVWAWVTSAFVVLAAVGGVLGALGVGVNDQLLVANFDQGPGPFVVGTRPNFSTDVVQGTYRMRITSRNSPVATRSLANLDRDVGAVAVRADVVRVTGTPADDAVGLGCFRANGDGYVFAAGTTGGYLILKGVDRQVTTIQANQAAPVSGSGRVERVGLTCVGSPQAPTKLWVSINGTTVATAQDPHGIDSFTTIGLEFAGDFGDEARFDNVLARVPTAEDSSLANSSPSPISSADRAHQVLLEKISVQTKDLAPGYSAGLIDKGEQVAGQVTLALCGASFPSEGMRVARRQSEVRDTSGRGVMGMEAVLYQSTQATAQAFRELRQAEAACPATFVQGPGAGAPALKTVFGPLPDSIWPTFPGVHRLAFDVMLSDQAGHHVHLVWVYLARGDVLLGLYFDQPDRAQPSISRQTTIEGITNLFESRIAHLP